MYRLLYACLGLWLVLMLGCQPEMTDQPRYEPFEASSFFADGRASRHLVPGTVARGHLQFDTPALTGMRNGQPIKTLPLEVNQALLERGQERYNIYCVPCHDQVGTGRGMIVRRGFPRAPSFHTGRLREAPIGHFFDVMSKGFGAMPSYAAQVAPEDRWAIAAYIRALQLSQYATLEAVPAAERQQLQDSTP